MIITNDKFPQALIDEREAMLKNYPNLFQVELNKILHSNKREFSDIRMAIYFDLRYKGYTYKYIGQIVGRHYSTIISGVKKFKEGLPFNRDFRNLKQILDK